MDQMQFIFISALLACSLIGLAYVVDWYQEQAEQRRHANLMALHRDEVERCAEYRYGEDRWGNGCDRHTVTETTTRTNSLS